MQPKQRRQAIQALQDAADSLMKSAGPRKRRNKKPRGTPDFKTTDEMLEYAMRHKGERDVPAPGIRYRGTTSDSEIPDTFGRVWASTVSARDLGRIDPKKFYVVIPFSDEYGKKEMADLSNGVLDGVLGISEKHEIIMQWYGIGRDAILVMDADKLTKINKLSRVQYDNPEYLVSNGMAALYRIFDKKRVQGPGSYGIAGNLIDHMLMGVKPSKKPGAEVLSEAKDLASVVRKHADELRRSIKALPFDDKGDLRSALRSVTDNQMDTNDFESFIEYRADKAVENLTEFSTSYNGLDERLIKLYLDRDDMQADSGAREAAALAPKAEAAALDYGWDATQTEALMKVMEDFATLVHDFDAIQALTKKASSEVGSFSGDNAISYALGYDRGRALETDFAQGTDDIKTVKGLAKRVHTVFSKAGGYRYEGIALASWERVIRKALKSIGQTFSDEGEWLVKDQKLKIPSGSTLFVTGDNKLPPDVEERRQAGTLTGLDEMVHGHEIKNAGRYDQMIKKYDLDKRYKVQRIDKAKFDKARSLYLTSPKKVAAATKKVVRASGPLILWHGAHRWEGPPTLQPAGKGKSEHGSGLYLTTSSETARKYAKGGGSVIRFEVDPHLTWADEKQLALTDVEAFLNSLPRVKNKNKILGDLRNHAARIKSKNLPAYVIENLMLNHGALTGDKGPALAMFFAENGIDAGHENHGNEDWVILYNLDKIKTWKKVPAGDTEDSPRLSRRPVSSSISDWHGKWIHFSKLPVLKINPKQFHQDPAGLYFFPEKFDPAGSWTKYNYKFTAELAPSAKVLDLSSLKAASALALVRKVTGEEPQNPEQFTDTSESKWDTPSSRAWEAMRTHFTGKPGAFNKALQRAGYDAVFDDTKAIHAAEVQLLVLNQKVVKVLSQEDLKKGSGFAAVEQTSTDLAKALESFGTVTKTPPRKGKGSWGGAPVLQATVQVKNGEKNAEFMLKADIERGTVNVSLRWSTPRLDYGVGAEFDIYRKRWDSDQFDRLLRNMTKVFEEPQALAASALLAAHKAVAEALAFVQADAFDPAKPLKPSDVLTVYHGTSLGNVVHFINGFDATSVQKRYYNGPKHRGIFVAPTPEWARKFGDVVLEIDIRAKNLHGTDYSGGTGRQHPEREQMWSEKHQDSFRPYLSQTMSQGNEPQALLIGLVSPKQIKRVLYKGQWYTRQKFLDLKLKTTPAPKPGRSFGETEVADLGIDIASTKYNFDQFLGAVAKLADVDLDRAKSTLASRAAIPVTNGRDALLELLERLFEPTAAKAYAKKFRTRLQESQ